MSIKTRFCAACGSQKTKLINNTCIDCYFKTIRIDVPKSAKISACPSCDSVNLKGFWVKADEEHDFYLTQAIIDKLKLPSGVELEDIEIIQTGKEGVVQLNLSVEGKRFSVTKPIELYVEDRLCDVDAKRKREAYEGTLQLRTEKDVHDFLAKISKIIEPFSSNVLKAEEVRTGIDFYFIEVSTMRQALVEIKKHIKLKLKESYEEYSWDKSKDRPKYRVTISARTE
jgi:NMD protein affecting ribosome stability and mRNA decay